MQGTSALLHDPMRVSTPLQRLANAARIERQNRINIAALKFSPPAKIIAKPPANHIPPEQFERAHAIIEGRKIEHSPFKIERIQRAVLQFYPKMTRADMLSIRRTKDVVMARQIAIFLCRKLTQGTLPSIGRAFGGRDHTTILFACRKIERLAGTDPIVAETVAQLTDMLSEAA